MSVPSDRPSAYLKAVSGARALRIALFAVAIALGAPAHAWFYPQAEGYKPVRDAFGDVVWRDEYGNPYLGPKYPKKDGFTAEFAEAMASNCADRPMFQGSEFTNEDLAAAIIALNLSIYRGGGFNRERTGPTGPTSGIQPVDIAALESAVGRLKACQFRNDNLERASRAFSSCGALLKELWDTDDAAASLFEAGKITKSEWIRALEVFLAPAQACRSKLGKCFNPNVRTQVAVYEVLQTLQTLLKLTGGSGVVLNVKLPVCNKTQISNNQDLPQNGTEVIEYININEGDAFLSKGGDFRDEDLPK
jgi:hypothetical protein